MKQIFLIILLFLVFPFSSEAAKKTSVNDEKGATNQKENGSEWEVSEVFKKAGGYFHPYITLAETYNDNIMNTQNNAKSDFSTTISPGFWVAIPRSRKQLVDISTSSFSPGGLTHGISSSGSFRRYQAYLMTEGDLTVFNRHSGEDTEDYKISAAFQLNLKGGLSGRIVEYYARGHNERATGDSATLDKYKNNYTALNLEYEINRRFKLRGSISNFDIKYDELYNRNSDRNDDSYSLYLFYKFRPQLSLFTQYRNIDVDYDASSGLDSDEDHFNLGMKWDLSQKTLGQLKLGFVDKKIQGNSGDNGYFSVLLKGTYKISSKTFIDVEGLRQVDESSDSSSNYSVRSAVDMKYSQQFTRKINFSTDLGYEKNEYNGVQTIGGLSEERADQFFSVEPALTLSLKKWLEAKFSYIYSERDSNFNNYDYSNNTFMINAGVAF